MVGICRNSNSSKLVTGKNEEDPIVNEGTGVFTTFLPSLVYGVFFPDDQGQLTLQSLVGSARIWPNFELVRDVMDVLVTRKNQE